MIAFRRTKRTQKYNNSLKKHFTTSIEIFYLYGYIKSGLTIQYIPTNNHTDNAQNSCRYADNQVFHWVYWRYKQYYAKHHGNYACDKSYHKTNAIHRKFPLHFILFACYKLKQQTYNKPIWKQHMECTDNCSKKTKQTITLNIQIYM